MSHRPDFVPHLMESDQDLPVTAQTMILVCTVGVLRQEHVLKALSMANDLGVAVLPVLSDWTFQIPVSPEELDCDNNSSWNMDPEAIFSLVKGVFTSIAVPF